jgi:hypothetical protein
VADRIDCSTRGRAAAALLLGALAVGAACEGDGDEGTDGLPTCVERDAAACTPLYEPTYARVYAETLQPRCGTPGLACHGEAGATGARNGLVIGDMTATHAALLDGGFVVEGDAACSPLMVRMDVDDDTLRMPPGSSALPEAERCAVAQWIAAGAPP